MLREKLLLSKTLTSYNSFIHFFFTASNAKNKTETNETEAFMNNSTGGQN